MLWSPSEVLAYLKDDQNVEENDAEKSENNLDQFAAFGGFPFKMPKNEDFILIAENSEIHGPNPLFTIPEVEAEIDLTSLSTRILSADYQGMSNNKILPGENAQLIMPDITCNIHAAINYFYLFDLEARGFVRPMCIAYFTSDKYKLIKSTRKLLQHLSEASLILQHSNIKHHSGDLEQLKNKLTELSSKMVSPVDIITEQKLEEMQIILNNAEKYKGNVHLDSLLANIQVLSHKFSSADIIEACSCRLSTDSTKIPSENLDFQPKSMKSLHFICGVGVILGLYHLHLMHKYFRRKYEHIAASDKATNTEGDNLHFGACILSSKQSSEVDHCSYPSQCLLNHLNYPLILSMESENYFHCFDNHFEEVLLRFINGAEKLAITSDTTSSSVLPPSSLQNNISSHSTGLRKDELQIPELECKHVVPLQMIWDIIELVMKDHPDLEASFLELLKLFDDTQRLLFALLTQIPIVVISTPQDLMTAQNFVKALSMFVPRTKKEVLFVDSLRERPLTKEELDTTVAANICLHENTSISDLLPLEFMPLCILNLKDCSLTAPMYTGRLLANIDKSIRSIPLDGPIFSIIISLLAEIERTVSWWHAITSSAADIVTAWKHVLSRGYSRSDMQIIEVLYKKYKS